MALFTPTNQKRLTNVAIVKLIVSVNRKKQKFEIACYPNKVYAWRQKLESNLCEVLQSEIVYSNVSKAEIASNDSLMEAFKTNDPKKVCEIILQKGELHLTEKERTSLQESLLKDVSKIVASKTINPETKSSFSPVMIEKMIKDCHINLKINKSAKQQSLDVIRLLKVKSGLPLGIAMISAAITIPQSQKKQIKNALLHYCDSIVKEDGLEVTALFEPGKFDSFKDEFGITCTIDVREIMEQSMEKKECEGKEDVESEADDEKGSIESHSTCGGTAKKSSIQKIDEGGAAKSRRKGGGGKKKQVVCEEKKGSDKETTLSDEEDDIPRNKKKGKNRRRNQLKQQQQKQQPQKQNKGTEDNSGEEEEVEEQMQLKNKNDARKKFGGLTQFEDECGDGSNDEGKREEVGGEQHEDSARAGDADGDLSDEGVEAKHKTNKKTRKNRH